ncbi:MAG: hypothetical protein LBT26_06425 [Clostridiales Family XIII bacterium]|jgi:type II secretory pathway pseudopilin PulG|nr:hypothetical protein [Clostridiales Family XIII bacterium]
MNRFSAGGKNGCFTVILCIGIACVIAAMLLTSFRLADKNKELEGQVEALRLQTEQQQAEIEQLKAEMAAAASARTGEGRQEEAAPPADALPDVGQGR